MNPAIFVYVVIESAIFLSLATFAIMMAINKNIQAKNTRKKLENIGPLFKKDIIYYIVALVFILNIARVIIENIPES